MPVLAVEDLRVSFEDDEGLHCAVDGVSLHVEAGEVLGIVGESGSGKTVTCAAAMGLLQGWPGVVSGSVRFDPGTGQEPVNLLAGLDQTLTQTVDGQPLKKRRAWRFLIQRQFMPWWGRGMTMIFQNPQTALHPFWRVGDIVGEAVRQQRPGITAADARVEGIRWLERVRLRDVQRLWTSHPHELSGGMAQRVMIAAALARGARLLFADEPTTGLDTTVKARIVELFDELRREENLAIVVISHDLGVVSSLADRILVMQAGEILESRSVEDIVTNASDLHPYTQRLLGAVEMWNPQGQANA